MGSQHFAQGAVNLVVANLVESEVNAQLASSGFTDAVHARFSPNHAVRQPMNRDKSQF
jgi:hypothetical protein